MIKSTDISVVIPYYNDSSVFERTIKSVLNQSLSVGEIIIVDDASQDSQVLIEIIYKYQSDDFIKYFRNDKNMNGAYSRNLGIKKSKNQIIALLDGDDYWLGDHIELCVKRLNDYNSDFIYSNIILKNNGEYREKVSDINVLDNKFDILFKRPPQTNSFIFKKKTLLDKNISFNEELKRHQDWQFLIDCIDAGLKIDYLDQYTTVYCEAVGDKKRKMDYKSIFKFWMIYSDKFSKKYLLDYLMIMSINCYIDYDYYYLEQRLNESKLSFILDEHPIIFLLMKKNFLLNKRLLRILYYSLFSRKRLYLILVKKISNFIDFQ